MNCRTVFALFIAFTFSLNASAADCEAVLNAVQIKTFGKLDSSWDYSIRLFKKTIADKERVIVLVQESPVKKKKNIRLGHELANQYQAIAVESNEHQNVSARLGLNSLTKLRNAGAYLPYRLLGQRYYRIADHVQEPPVIDLEKNWQPSPAAQRGSIVAQVVGYTGLLLTLGGATLTADYMYAIGQWAVADLEVLRVTEPKDFFMVSPLHQIGVYEIINRVKDFVPGIDSTRRWIKENYWMVYVAGAAAYYGLKGRLTTVLDFYPPRAFSKDKALFMAQRLDEAVQNSADSSPTLVLIDDASGTRVGQTLLNDLGYSEIPLEEVLATNDSIEGTGVWASMRRRVRHYRLAYERWAQKNLPADGE